MPLPDDPAVVHTGQAVLAAFKTLAGPHPGFRPAHAKGLLATGTFTPTAAAAALSCAAHFAGPPTPVLARFSSSTGLPQLPDSAPEGNPRGFALRFRLADAPRRVHTDIVAHSVPLFPAGTPADTLAFFQAVVAATGASPDSAPDPTALNAHLAAHPAAAAFVALPKPTPAALAHEAYYAVNAVRLVSAAGAATAVRYRVEPAAGRAVLSDAEAAAQPADFLYDGVRQRLAGGAAAGQPLSYTLLAQVARDGDRTDDATVLWPDAGADARDLVALGTVVLDGLVADDAAQQKQLIFDPVPRVPGVAPSDDPLLDLRAAVYLLSGRERRAA